MNWSEWEKQDRRKQQRRRGLAYFFTPHNSTIDKSTSIPIVFFILFIIFLIIGN